MKKEKELQVIETYRPYSNRLMRGASLTAGKTITTVLALLAFLLVTFGAMSKGICTGTVTAGFDPTSTLSGAFTLVATDLGVIVPIALGIAVIFWLVRKGVRMFKGGSNAILFGLGLLFATSAHSSADPIFATFAAGYDPTTNITDALGLVATSLATLVPIVLGVAVIFWLVRKGVKMFKGGSN